MKRIFAALLAASLLVLCGCGTSPPTDTPSPEDPSPPEDTSSPAENSPSENPEPSDIPSPPEETDEPDPSVLESAKLYYQGHSSLRFTTAEGKVIYVDPYTGDGYDLAADLILVTHQHDDHNKVNLIETQNPDCQIITEKEALLDGVYQTFDLGFVKVEATYAENKNHSSTSCVGYILTLADNIQVYISGDTDQTEQMASFAERNFDYALFCCDGVYNMDAAAASECAALVGAKNNIPYHTMPPGTPFSMDVAEQFTAENRLIVEPGQEIELA